MEMIAEIARSNEKLAEELMRLLNEIELARLERLKVSRGS